MKKTSPEKLNKSGLTLIEMLVSFAVLGIVIIMVGGFMVTGSKLFTKVNAETNLQEESQMALNQAENIVIDAGLGINYGVTADGVYNFYDSDPTGALTDKILYVFSYDAADAGVKVLMIGYNSTDSTLYYKEASVTNPRGGTDVAVRNMPEADPADISASGGWDVLALNVSDFSADLTDYHSGKSNRITLKITLFKTNDRNSSYTAEGTVTLRNTVEINAETVSKIFERVSYTVRTNIKAVNLTMASYTVVKGETYQLYTKVIASSGYPSQEIAWYEVKDADTDMTRSGCSVNRDTKELSVGPSVTAAKLKVYAYAATGRAKADDVADGVWIPDADDCTKGIYTKDGYEYVYDYAVVSIKTITDFCIQPDSEKPYTVTLRNNWDTQSRVSVSDFANAPVFSANPGNTFSMTGVVTGTGLDSDDMRIEWSVANQSQGVSAQINANGYVEISKFSKSGTFVICANPKIRSSDIVCYVVNVGNSQITSQSLQFKYDSTMNRGASQTLGLTMNGVAVTASEFSDFNWSKQIRINGSSARVDSGSVSLSGASLSVSDSLAYEYSYVITVRAELKNDSSVFAERKISVPKVSLKMTPSVYYADRNSTVDYGKIKCVVTGIENYSLLWSIASRTNPNTYSTATNNNSYISVKSGDAYKDTALIHISGREPANLEYIRVKAVLSGHSNYYATAKINLSGKNGFSWGTPQTTNVSRGSSVKLNVTSTADDFSISDVEWRISAKDSSGRILSTEGISADNSGNLNVDSDYELTDSSIYITVKPAWAGIEAEEKTFTLAGVSFTVSGASRANRGGAYTYTVDGGYTYIQGSLRWSYTLNGNAPTDTDGITLNAATGELKIDRSFDTANGTDTILIYASAQTASGKTITSAAKRVSVNKISILISGPEKSGNNSYTVKAAVTGFASQSDYTVDWTLGGSGAAKTNLLSAAGLNNTVTLTERTASDIRVSVTASVSGFADVSDSVNVTFEASSVTDLLRKPADLENRYFSGISESKQQFYEYYAWLRGDNVYKYYVMYKKYTDSSAGVTYYKLTALYERDYFKGTYNTASGFTQEYWAKHNGVWYKYAGSSWAQQTDGPSYGSYDMGF